MFKGLNVDEGDENHCAGDLRGIKLVDEFFNRNDGGVFSTVGTRDKSQDRTALFAIDDDDRNIRSDIDTSGDFQLAH